MHIRDISLNDRVTCEGDPGTVEWINVDTNDIGVRFDDDPSPGLTYIDPADLRPAR